MINLALIVITVLLNTAGQFVMKIGMNQVGRIALNSGGVMHGFLRAAGSPLVIVGFVLYGLSAAMWLIILSRVNLSWAYPLVSISYVIVALFSSTVLHERFSLARLVGTLVICLGVALVARTPSQ
jgi:drug/metabolite transporter (DMT)-like permease